MEWLFGPPRLGHAASSSASLGQIRPTLTPSDLQNRPCVCAYRARARSCRGCRAGGVHLGRVPDGWSRWATEGSIWPVLARIWPSWDPFWPLLVPIWPRRLAYDDLAPSIWGNWPKRSIWSISGWCTRVLEAFSHSVLKVAVESVGFSIPSKRGPNRQGNRQFL